MPKNVDIIRVPTAEEVKDSVKSKHLLNALRLDGFQGVLYIYYCDIVGNLVVLLV